MIWLSPCTRPKTLVLHDMAFEYFATTEQRPKRTSDLFDYMVISAKSYASGRFLKVLLTQNAFRIRSTHSELPSLLDREGCHPNS